MKTWKKLITGLAILFVMAGFGGFWVGEAAGSSEIKPMPLSLSSWTGAREPALDAWKQMSRDLEEATGGKVKVKIYYSQALGKAKEHYELALKGVADIAYINVGFTPGRFPITDLVAFSQAPSAEIMTYGLVKLVEKGYLNKDYEKVKLLYIWTGTPNQILWRKGSDPGKTLSGLRSKQLRVPSTAAADLLRALGANPVAIPMPEVYTAMERGVINGTITAFASLDVFKLSYVCNEISRLNSLTYAFCLVMNKAKWEKLPDVAKAVFEKNARNYSLMAAAGHDRADKAAIERNKPKIYDFSPQELKKIKELIGPSLKQYIRKYEALGFQAKEAAALYYETLKTKYGVEPFILQ